MADSHLSMSGLCKRYGDFTALAPTDLEVADGEFLTLLGPSGSGKTTLLGLIAGLSQPDGGRLRIKGADVTWSPPYERDIGMVFQNYALFPHMTVEENIAFPLTMRKVAPAAARERARAALETVRLPQVAGRLPKELSGGQQQRIALARCLVYRPSIILMDEPLGALDKKLRDHLQLEIKRIHRELGTTIVYVTHDQEEAMTLSDRICLMNGGRIEQLGTPADLYFRPRSVFAADFLGESNLLDGRVASAGGDELAIALDGGRTTAPAVGNGAVFTAGQPVKLLVRPQNLVVSRGAATVRQTEDGQGLRPTHPCGQLAAKVIEVMITGSLTKLYLSATLAGETPLSVAFPTSRHGESYRRGEPVTVSWQAGDAVAIPVDPAVAG